MSPGFRLWYRSCSPPGVAASSRRRRGDLAAQVSDEGAFFSAEAVEKADAKIKEIYRDYGRGLLVDTVGKVPDRLQDKYKELGKKDFFTGWARQRAEDARAKGVYVLICREPARLQVEIDRATRVKAFTAEDRERLLKKIVPLLREKQNDATLSETVDFVQATLKANLGKRAAIVGGMPRGGNMAPMRQHRLGSGWGSSSSCCWAFGC